MHASIKPAFGTVSRFVKARQGSLNASLNTQYNRLRDRHVCIGVTGLSQSGKSTFITSLINQLLHHDNANMSGFSPVMGNRLLGVKLHPPADVVLDTFPYEASYQMLAGSPPAWPPSTTGASGCIIELRLSKSGLLSEKRYSLFVEIRDYPGEWLLDLSLRNQSYLDWCRRSASLYDQTLRQSLMGDLHSELSQLNPLATVDHQYLGSLHRHFQDFLKTCKKEGLSLIQPGRFLLPDVSTQKGMLNFIPLTQCANVSENDLTNAGPDSYYMFCKSQYDEYVNTLVDPFYKQFFSKIDRQLVLVDVIRALNAGPERFSDMQSAMTDITDSFAYGKQSRFFQLFQPKVDKVVFVATKIDQVPATSHENVRKLLASIIKSAYRSARHEGVDPVCEAAASVRASQESERGIVGFDKDGEGLGYDYPDIPARIPEPHEWHTYQAWRIPELSPPVGMVSNNDDAFPHIRMDAILNALVGDKC